MRPVTSLLLDTFYYFVSHVVRDQPNNLNSQFRGCDVSVKLAVIREKRALSVKSVILCEFECIMFICEGYWTSIHTFLYSAVCHFNTVNQ